MSEWVLKYADPRGEVHQQVAEAGTEKELRDRFLRAMLEAALPLQADLEPEISLQALIRAADMLKERFEQELDEIRQEAD